jgi:uncharacterized protein
MSYFIDRRLNPKGKSLGNRQRFLRRARKQIKEAVQKSLKDRSVSDFEKNQKISIPSEGTKEPSFRHASSGGTRDYVHPGNKEFTEGDRVRKPPAGGGQGQGKEASDDGEGEDEFTFTLTQDEVLDIFFEDLELPNLAKTSLKQVTKMTYQRAGISVAGAPTNLNLIRTMRNSFGRRLALNRPKAAEIEALKERLFFLETKADRTSQDHAEIKSLIEEMEALEKKRQWVPYIDPMDVRFNAFEPRPTPSSQAVMFCLMDVSGSMGEREKDLAKRFYILLHLFLKRRYEKVDIVFIRHTHTAQEVDEETFFYSRQSGGTIVSTALDEMLKIWAERYPIDEWNIYAAQASDGYTQSGDAQKCVEMLTQEILPNCQFYSYIEILDEREMEVFADDESGAELWRAYRSIFHDWDHFTTKRISNPGDIFPVFRELFSKESQST